MIENKKGNSTQGSLQRKNDKNKLIQFWKNTSEKGTNKFKITYLRILILLIIPGSTDKKKNKKKRNIQITNNIREHKRPATEQELENIFAVYISDIGTVSRNR